MLSLVTSALALNVGIAGVATPRASVSMTAGHSAMGLFGDLPASVSMSAAVFPTFEAEGKVVGANHAAWKDEPVSTGAFSGFLKSKAPLGASLGCNGMVVGSTEAPKMLKPMNYN